MFSLQSLGPCGQTSPPEEHPLIMEAKKELLGTDSSTTLEQDLRNLFNQIDEDKSGNLSLDEIVVFFKAITDDISIGNINNIFQEIDDDKNCFLDFNEFKVIMHKIISFSTIFNYFYFRSCSTKSP